MDAILNTKYREMIEKNIIFVFRINDLSNLIVSDEHIVVILSNLLNNSIEHVKSVKEEGLSNSNLSLRTMELFYR